MIITPLGTVSPYCKNDTNCPGFLIETDNKKFLLDCGNGISRLMKFPNDLNNLNIIITHYHKDHFGEIGILQYASYVYHKLGLLNKPINIYLPREDYQNSKRTIIKNEESYATYNDIESIINIDNVKLTFYDNNSHLVKSYMIKIESEDLKIIYTSDIGTTNMMNLIKFCRDADLLICESSFLKSHNSNSKTHLTASTASEIARLANVKQLLLTHFWPEEDKEKYKEEAKKNFNNTEVAIEGKKLILGRK